MKPTYQIKHWNRYFETTESKRVINARWVPLPNKQDGKGYRRVAQHRNGVNIFCAWTLILQISSKMPTRGLLADHDGPLDAEDLAAKTGFPARIFQQALEYLSDKRIGWIEVLAADPQIAADAADTPSNGRMFAGNIPSEGNNKEGNNKEEDQAPFHGVEFVAALAEFEQHRKEIRHKITPTARRKVYAEMREWGEEKSIRALNLSVKNGWRGLFDPDSRNGERNGHKSNTASDRNVARIETCMDIIRERSGEADHAEPVGWVAASTHRSRVRGERGSLA